MRTLLFLVLFAIIGACYADELRELQNELGDHYTTYHALSAKLAEDPDDPELEEELLETENRLLETKKKIFIIVLKDAKTDDEKAYYETCIRRVDSMLEWNQDRDNVDLYWKQMDTYDELKKFDSSKYAFSV